ncbi:hypothetical protein HHI36_007163 [Cryptolaemus montrouzieri]|uniref:Uncharacterized protein n=1 Tax=Cryptolaemus montrouzieri TaxID=559131 RepID=A0ABD2MNQ6_9CUCU
MNFLKAFSSRMRCGTLAFILIFVLTTATLNHTFVLLEVKDHNASYGGNVEKKRFLFTAHDMSRGKKHQHKHLILPLVVAALLIKSIIFPLTVKAMAVMTSIAVLLSSMSLIISSIVGYAKLAYYKASHPSIKVVHVNKPWNKHHAWAPQEAIYLPPPVFESKYITSDPFFLDDEETKVIDHYHSFVD